jgi:hemolysin III
VVLYYLATVHGSAVHVLTCTVFGAALTAVYVLSTLYHLSSASPRKQLLRVLDHCSIYVLIAATYAPFALVLLQGAWGWTVFGLAWGVAGIGIVLKSIPRLRDHEGLSITSYLVAGCLGFIAIQPVLASMDPGVLWLILTGGVSYIVGVSFYAWDGLPYNHLIWHVFVLMGSALHFCGVLFYVIP